MSQLIITLGDPYSVNIELISTLLHNSDYKNLKITLVGSLFHWKDQCKLPIDLNTVEFVDVGGEEKRASQLSAQSRGRIAVDSLRHLERKLSVSEMQGRDLLHSPPIETKKSKTAILTCPIDKHAAHEAGFAFPGHTEFFTDMSQNPTLMLLAGPKLRVGLVTNHLALKDVSKTLTQELIVTKLSILYKTLQQSFSIPSPRIAVCGLNPHCSDGGIFGDEEERIIKPALAKFGSPVEGPLPADTIFYGALQGSYDAVLAMYHDQGLGPLKTVHFDEAVNITCGLPYLRLSPDHGPAKDLFMQGKASIRSMQTAWDIARRYVEARS